MPQPSRSLRPARDGLRISYSPDIDGDPDAGEIVWTWVPYAENDGRGKDRPVLVVSGASDADRVFAVRLTSKSHDGDRDFLSIGTRAVGFAGRDRRGSTSISSTAFTPTACGARHPRWIPSDSRGSQTRCVVGTAGLSRTEGEFVVGDTRLELMTSSV